MGSFFEKSLIVLEGAHNMGSFFETNLFSQTKIKTQSNSDHAIQISIVSKTKIGIKTQ